MPISFSNRGMGRKALAANKGFLRIPIHRRLTASLITMLEMMQLGDR